MIKKFLNFLKISCCVIFIHLNIQYASATALKTLDSDKWQKEDILRKLLISRFSAEPDTQITKTLAKDTASRVLGKDTVPACDSLSKLQPIDSISVSDSAIKKSNSIVETSGSNGMEKVRDSVKHWAFEGHVLLNFSQLMFTNWSLGGENAIAGNTLEDFLVTYKSEKATWENSMKFASGIVKQNGNKMRKTDDRLEMSSKYGRRINNKFNYSVFADLQTQFFPGYKSEDNPNKISDFFAPAYITTSLGLDFRPTQDISLFCSPVGGKITIVNSNFILNSNENGEGAFGVRPGHHSNYELGGSMVLSAKGEIFKGLYAQVQVNGFSSYQKRPDQITWSSEFLLSMKINKFLSANVKGNFLYDPETSLKPQFKEFFGLGFSYKL